MSYRLDSLNSKKTGAKPALKFKPKAVARKSKEDRDKDVALLKTEEKPRVPAPTRGRGGSRGRGGRGRGGSYGTQVIAAGPLALGSVGMGGGTTSSKTGLTNDKIYGGETLLGASSITGLKLKSRSSRALTPFEESDDEDDPLKINMSKDYAFEDSETTLFPVRPHKDLVKVEQSATASVTVLVNSSRAQTVESVKTETSDEVAGGQPLGPNDPVVRAEHDKMIDDQNAIVDLITSNMAGLKTAEDELAVSEEDKYIIFHIPQVLPKEQQELVETSPFASEKVQNLEGHIGNLNFHKLGKITMTLGEGTVFDVTRGVSPSFLQEVFVLDSFEARRKQEEGEDEMADVLDVDGRKISGDIYRLGEVSGKIIATPSFS